MLPCDPRGNIADGKGGDLFEAMSRSAAARSLRSARFRQGKEEIDARGAGGAGRRAHPLRRPSAGADITRPRRTASPRRSWAIAASALRLQARRPHGRSADGRRGGYSRTVLSAVFPRVVLSDYMSWLSKRNFDVVGAQLPHGAARPCDTSGARRDPSTEDDNNKADGAAEAVALARSLPTSRTLNHRTSTGDFADGRRAKRGDCGGHADAVAACCLSRPLHHQRRPADDAAGRRQHQIPIPSITRTTACRSAGGRRWTRSGPPPGAGSTSPRGSQRGRPAAARARLSCSDPSSYKAIAHLPLRKSWRSCGSRRAKAILSEMATATDDPLFFRRTTTRSTARQSARLASSRGERSARGPGDGQAAGGACAATPARCRMKAAACSMCRSSTISTVTSTPRGRC